MECIARAHEKGGKLNPGPGSERGPRSQRRGACTLETFPAVATLSSENKPKINLVAFDKIALRSLLWSSQSVEILGACCVWWQCSRFVMELSVPARADKTVMGAGRGEMGDADMVGDDRV